MTWHYNNVVQWNGESFKGEGVFNVAIPCDSSQEFFYVCKTVSVCVHYKANYVVHCTIHACRLLNICVIANVSSFNNFLD